MPLEGYNNGSGIASVDAAGAMPPGAYQLYAGAPPTDPTAPIDTISATSVYVEASVTGVVTTLDGISVAYRYCYDAGWFAAGPVKVLMICPGFALDGSAITNAELRRFASYGFLVIAPTTRGRGAIAGQLDYVRDTRDRLDIFDHVTALVGSSHVWTHGRSFFAVGYSTGGLDAALLLARATDRVRGIALYFPNYDLIEYWQVVSPTIRSTYLVGQVGNLAQRSAAALDPYRARNVIDALPRLLALSTCKAHVWILGDRTEAPNVPIPGPDRLAAACRAIPAAAAKTHVHISQSGDARRFLHDSGISGTDSVYGERFFVPAWQAITDEWVMPREAHDLRLLGWMTTRPVTGSADPIDDRPGWELWTGTTSPPRSNTNGGTKHAAALSYLDAGELFTLKPLASVNGYAQLLRDEDDRRITITAGVEATIDLSQAPSIAASLAEIGFDHAFFADEAGTVTGTTTVTKWTEAPGFGARELIGAGGTEPATFTDGDGEACIRFTAANYLSGDKLSISSGLVDPRADFTVAMVVNKRDSADGHLFAVSHHGSLAELSLRYASGCDSAYYVNDAGASGLAGVNGVGGQTFSQNAKHLVVLKRETHADGVARMAISIDGSAWSELAITSDSFTFASNVTTTIACGWANGGGVDWQFANFDVYALITKDGATSDADVGALWAFLKTRFTF